MPGDPATRPNPYRQHLILLIAFAGLAGAVTAAAVMVSLNSGIISVLRDAIELVSEHPKTSDAIRLQRVEMIQRRLLSCSCLAIELGIDLALPKTIEAKPEPAQLVEQRKCHGLD
jgi:hypothetical protein